MKFKLLPVQFSRGTFKLDSTKVTSQVSLPGLVALCVEIALHHDLEHEDWLATQEDVESGEVGRESVGLGGKSIASEMRRILGDGKTEPSKWLHPFGKNGSRTKKDRVWDNLALEEGAIPQDGNRNLDLLLTFPGADVQIATKKVHCSGEGMYHFSSCSEEAAENDVWTAEELVLLMMLVLSDERVCREYPDYDCHFLFEDLAPHLQISEASLALRAQLPDIGEALQRVDATQSIQHVEANTEVAAPGLVAENPFAEILRLAIEEISAI